jgi:hypothetical protein
VFCGKFLASGNRCLFLLLLTSLCKIFFTDCFFWIRGDRLSAKKKRLTVMTAICSNRDQYVRELDNYLRIMQNPDTKYSFGSAILDMSGIGTLYQVGADFADLSRTSLVFEWMQQNNNFAKGSLQYTAAKTAELVQAELSDRQLSLASKVFYLGALATLFASPNNPISMAGCITSGAYFLLKAGFNATERMSDSRVQSLRNQLA